MKRILNILLSAAGAMLILSSCEDFLTKMPETDLFPEEYFKSETQLKLWTNGFYTMFESAADLTLQFADDHISTSALSDIQRGTRTPGSESWKNTFNKLRDVNYLLEHSSSCPSEAIREQYNGVAYFFRAYFYYNMVRKYGDMPYYDYVISADDEASLKKPRDSRAFVMYKIMSDLDKAAERLPEKWKEESVFRVSKYAALALKSRAALFEGTFRKYHNLPDETIDGQTIGATWFLTQAADAAQAVMASGKYSMYTATDFNLEPGPAPYRQYFILMEAETQETILSRAYSDKASLKYPTQNRFNAYGHSATRRFVNHYLKADGTALTKTELATMEFSDHTTGRDPRLAQTIQTKGYVTYQSTNGAEEINWANTINGYKIIKFMSSHTFDSSDRSEDDIPLFRYGEVLLNYAEAKAELGTITQTDIDNSIKLLRDRAGMPNLNLATANTTPDALMQEYYPNCPAGTNQGVILEIRRERTVELFSEGFRLWDLLRWKEGKFLTAKALGGFEGAYFPALGEIDFNGDGTVDLLLYQGTKPGTISSTITAQNQIQVGTEGNFVLSDTGGIMKSFTNETYVWNEDRDYLWPIPTDQRVISGMALTQNPGYDDGL